MATLDANASVPLGSYPLGAQLIISAPKSDNIYDFPELNGVTITLTFVPKTLTLAAKTPYTLKAGNAAITYEVKV